MKATSLKESCRIAVITNFFLPYCPILSVPLLFSFTEEGLEEVASSLEVDLLEEVASSLEVVDLSSLEAFQASQEVDLSSLAVEGLLDPSSVVAFLVLVVAYQAFQEVAVL